MKTINISTPYYFQVYFIYNTNLMIMSLAVCSTLLLIMSRPKEWLFTLGTNKMLKRQQTTNDIFYMGMG